MRTVKDGVGSMVQFDAPRLKALKVDYDKSVASGQHEFTHDGNQYLVAYAKYLIEYLEIRLGVTV